MTEVFLMGGGGGGACGHSGGGGSGYLVVGRFVWPSSGSVSISIGTGGAACASGNYADGSPGGTTSVGVSSGSSWIASGGMQGWGSFGGQAGNGAGGDGGSGGGAGGNGGNGGAGGRGGGSGSTSGSRHQAGSGEGSLASGWKALAALDANPYGLEAGEGGVGGTSSHGGGGGGGGIVSRGGFGGSIPGEPAVRSSVSVSGSVKPHDGEGWGGGGYGGGYDGRYWAGGAGHSGLVFFLVATEA